MSISENVGGIVLVSERYCGQRKLIPESEKRRGRQAEYGCRFSGEKIVDQIRKTKSGIKQLFVPGMLFEDMGITYLGPVDGHDIRQLYEDASERRSGSIDAVLVHVRTTKGQKGMLPAEKTSVPGSMGSEPFDALRPDSRKGARVKAQLYRCVLQRAHARCGKGAGRCGGDHGSDGRRNRTCDDLRDVYPGSFF